MAGSLSDNGLFIVPIATFLADLIVWRAAHSFCPP
jgi:hypothetical protein